MRDMFEVFFSHHWIYHKMKIHFGIWLKSSTFFFKKQANIFNFRFKYVKLKDAMTADEQEVELGRDILSQRQ